MQHHPARFQTWHVRLTLLALGPLLLVRAAAWAAGQATPDEAKAMAIKAAEYLKSVGPGQGVP